VTTTFIDEKANVDETPYVPDSDPRREMPDWLTAIAIAVSIAILIFVFAWIVIRLEPFLSDFIATDTTTTVTPTN
jgi:hypothetical protein